MTDMTEDIFNTDLDLTEEEVHDVPLYHIEPRLTLQRSECTKVRNAKDAIDYVCNHVRTLTHEAAYAIFLDVSHSVNGFTQVGQGVVDGSSISTAKILQCMLLTGSKYLILIHNHPGMDKAYPSYMDTQTARRIRAALIDVDRMVLEDFIIITPSEGEGSAYSMRVDGLLKGNPCRGVDTESAEYKEHQEYMKKFLSSKKAS